MSSNSDLIPNQNDISTTNPQSAGGSLLPNQTSSFQQSAGTDSLSQNHQISVVQTGQAVKETAPNNTTTLMWVFVVVASIVLIMITSSVFKWVMKRPDSEKPKEESKVKQAETKALNRKSKKKLPRSKRHK